MGKGGYGLYRAATWGLGPFLPLVLRRRLRRGKEDPARIGERLGHATLARPPGPLVWLHAASVGELVSVLPLAAGLRRARPGLNVLVTSGSVTAAATFRARAGDPLVLHQFVPLDHPGAVARFFRHWRPGLGLLAESELWPNLIAAARRRHVPLVLVNGRMSARSFAKWRRRLGLARFLLGGFPLVLAQAPEDAARFRALGAARVETPGNLKFDAEAPACDPAALDRLRQEIGGRPLVLAASTHEGEERLLARVHTALKAEFPGLLTIIVPRHPERGTGLAAALGAGLVVARRAGGGHIEAGTDLYIADTLGELGLFYRVATVAFVGGSLVPHGGQNVIEAARCGVGVLTGPHTANFAPAVALLAAAGALTQVADAEALRTALAARLRDPALAGREGALGRAAAAGAAGALARTLEAILPLVPAWPAAPH